MIVCQIAIMTEWQLYYTFADRDHKGIQSHKNIDNQSLNACQFITILTFNLAHWILAFSYFVLSWRIELIKNKNLSEDTYDCRLKTANIIVCIFNVALPVIVWICDAKEKFKVADLTFDIEQLSLVISCTVLIWGICRLVKLVESLSDQMVNKVMIAWHIVAYLLIFVVSMVWAFYSQNINKPKVLEITTICYVVV